MAVQIAPRLSVAEYLALEAASEVKHEYAQGELYEMPRVTGTHSRISTNCIAVFVTASGCAVHSSDLSVRIGNDRYYYPDLSVACGRERYEDGELTRRC